MLKNQASQVVRGHLVLRSDGSNFAGTATVAITIDSGAMSTSPAGSIVSDGLGQFSYFPTQAETNGSNILFLFYDAGATAIPDPVQIYTRQDLATTLNATKNNTDNILGDTNELQVNWGTGGSLKATLDAAAVQATLTDVSSRLPAALVSGRMSADVVSISGSTAAADRLEDAAEIIAFGTAQAGTLSTTEMTTNLTVVNASQFLGRKMYFKEDTTTAALRGVAKEITAVTVSGAKLGFSALPSAPVAGDTFVITG